MSFAENALKTWVYRRQLRERSGLFEPDFLQAMPDINYDQHGVNAATEFANTSASACDVEYHLQKTMYNLSRQSDHCNGALH